MRARSADSADLADLADLAIRLRGLVLSAMLVLALALHAPARAQRFEIQPASADVVVGEPLAIRLSGLPPGADVTLVATRMVREFFGGRRLYSAQASYRIGADGRLDLATQAPLAGGSYSGVDLRGLMWSMTPVAAPPAAVAASAGVTTATTATATTATTAASITAATAATAASASTPTPASPSPSPSARAQTPAPAPAPAPAPTTTTTTTTATTPASASASAPTPTPTPTPAQAWQDGEVRLQARLADGAGARDIATQTLRLRAAAATLQWRDATPFPGARLAWLPTAVDAGRPTERPAKRPAIIALGGSEGGSAIVAAAGLLASHGYAVLGLPYYAPGGFGPTGPTPPELPGLPAAFADIPVDRLEQARAWLAQQPEVDASRIAVYGVSKGAEFALIAATRMPWITSVVAIVPSDVVWEGWGPGTAPGQRSSFAWQGKPLPFVPYQDFEKEFLGFQTGEPVLVRRPQDRGRAANPDRVPAARIPIETYAGPVLVVGGHADQVWDSGGMAEAIAATRQAAGRPTVLLSWRDAGHALSGTGWSPTTQSNASPMKMGGQPAADARAQAESFARTLQFLHDTLQAAPARP